MKDKKEIENEILMIAQNLLKEWESAFKEKGICIDPISVANNNNADNYFSEIEYTFWKDDELLTAFSVIIFLNNNQILDIDKAKEYIDNELKICYQEVF